MTRITQRTALRLLALTAAVGMVAIAGQAQAQQKALPPALAVQNLNIAKINPSALKALGNLNANGGTTTTNAAGVPTGNTGKDSGETPGILVRTVTVDTTPGRDIPRRGDDGKDTPTTDRPGETRNLNQLQSISSIGQLSQAPLQRSFEAPRPTTLNKLENRLTASVATAQAKAGGTAGRDQAIQALDGAKPLI